MALTQVSTKGIKDATLLNEDVNASAAIAGSKISPNFSGQNIVNSGTLTTGQATATRLTISGSTVPLIDFIDSDNNPDFSIRADVGSFRIKDTTSNVERLIINSDGKVGIGTTSPNAKLQIHNTGTPDSQLLRLVNTQHDTNAASSAQLKFGITNSLGERNCRIEAKEEGGNLNDVALDFYTNLASSTDGEALRMRIDSRGRVGIRNTSMSSFNGGGDDLLIGNGTDGEDAGITLLSHSSDNCSIFFNDTSDTGITGLIQYRHDVDALRIFTATAERMRIDSSGNTHFGSSGTLSGTNTVSIIPADGRISFGMDGRSSFVTGENGAYIYSGDGISGTTLAGDLILQSRSNQNRTIRFVTGDGSTSPSPVERGKFNEFGLNVTGQVSGKALSASSSKAGNFDPYVFDVNGSAQSTETVAIKSQKNDCLDLTRYYTAGTIQTFRFNNDFTGHIETGTTSVTYHTSSDYRLKENAVAISDGITRLKQLKPYKFNFIKEPSVIHDGFFAHEVTPVVPTAVSGVKDATETRYYETGDILPEGKEIGDIKEENAVKPQSLDHSKLVPLLTAALKEEITKREALETRVAALEAA